MLLTSLNKYCYWLQVDYNSAVMLTWTISGHHVFKLQVGMSGEFGLTYEGQTATLHKMQGCNAQYETKAFTSI